MMLDASLCIHFDKADIFNKICGVVLLQEWV